ncbi:hypothetical protein QBC38DRAFT_52884 [Podospora fimiseda]|uniref:Protein NO VEIN C-terminal domain-containing protein n=1 Tax=Podospora fimiseda TaxID=252190 RepID=A0AAN7BH61_9PEZI|nr:hypothetical protein QBC38DRAFT_52884 [Podospora fimiseda]
MTDVSPYIGKLSRSGSCFIEAPPQFTTHELGAAVELFVFEHLTKFQQTLAVLPGFSLDDWTSGLKAYADVHPEYENLVFSYYPATADLEYQDDQGVFTQYLIGLGHLESESWFDKKPRYYFEVKSTPLDWNTPLYMSGEQYKKMKRICVDDDSVYIIFRVFNMLTDRIDVKLYINPAQLEEQGKLDFTTIGDWVVAPGIA